jgi:hypothetical protein
MTAQYDPSHHQLPRGGGGGGAADGGFRGTWDSGTAYIAGDIVVFGRAAYGALSGSTNHQPVTPSALLTGVPGTVDSADAGSYEMGVAFTTSKALRLTGIGYYRSTANVGTHVGRLWNQTTPGSEFVVLSGTFDDLAATPGPQVLPLPYDLPAGAWFASMAMPSGHYSVDAHGYDAAKTVGSVTAPIGAGRYSNTLAHIPDQIGNNSNYWVYPLWDEPDSHWALLSRF